MQDKAAKSKGQSLPADRATGDMISQRLREYYEAVKEESIPDRFLDLLERLDEADQAHREKKPSPSHQNGDTHV